MDIQPTKGGEAAAAMKTRLSAASVWMIVGAATFMLSTLILLGTMERWPDPYQTHDRTSALFYPIGPGPKAMPAINADLLDVYASDESHVWVVGKNSLIAFSKDGGATWEKATIVYPPIVAPPAPTTNPAALSLGKPNPKGDTARRMTAKRAPATSTEGSTGSSDAKQQDQKKYLFEQRAAPPQQTVPPPKSPEVKKHLTSFFSIPSLVSEAYGFSGELNQRRFISVAGLSVPVEVVPALPHENLILIHEYDSSRPPAVFGAAGGVYTTSDGSVWTYRGCATYRSPIPAHTSGYLRVGAHGRIENSRFNPVARPPTLQNLNGICTIGLVAWVVGDHGVILHTTNGGVIWRHQTRESTYKESLLAGSPLLPVLPPWYLIANAFSAYAFLRSRTEAKKLTAVEPRQWIDSKGERDAPLTPEDRESRNLAPLAKAIADFIRNPETKPPMTIAVTGAWGSGKSSLMNLIRGDLVKSAWRPVWFNAWHHQKEESLLAALLQSIRMQAVPKLWERGGPSFFTRLFLIRLRNYQARVIGLAMLVCFTIGFVMTYPLILDGLKDHSTVGHGLMERITDFLPPSTANFLLSAGTTLTVLYGLFKGLSAFGVKPAELLAEFSRGARIKDLDAQTTFRERFASEFREVTDALNPWRSMLIFVDDLDRCHPDNVVEVLESVNFLVSSGDCFVILGMARDKVQPAVGLAFKEMAAEMDAPPDATATGEEAARQRRHELARDYLDKLINFEVAVPRLSPAESLKSLTDEEEDPAPPWWRIDPLRAAAIATLSAITVLLPLSMLFTGISAATMAYVAHSAHDRQYLVHHKPVASQPKGGAPDDSRAGAPISIDAAVQAVNLAAVTSDQPGTISRAAEVRDRWMYWPVFVPILVLLWIVISLIRRADEEVVRDSKEFTDALAIWHPVLYDRLPTPRAMKRFKNKVRFLAMRVRGDANPNWQIPEHAIVALAATRLRFSSIRTLADFAAKNAPQDDLFVVAYREHIEKFSKDELDQFDQEFDADVRDIEFR